MILGLTYEPKSQGLIQLSVIMEIFYTYAIQNGNHQPHVTSEHWDCGNT